MLWKYIYEFLSDLGIPGVRSVGLDVSDKYMLWKYIYDFYRLPPKKNGRCRGVSDHCSKKHVLHDNCTETLVKNTFNFVCTLMFWYNNCIDTYLQDNGSTVTTVTTAQANLEL